MSRERIELGLQLRLEVWAAAQVPPLPIAWPNTAFEPLEGLYARASIQPAPTTSADLAGAHRGYTGVFQISFYLPLQEGSHQTAILADSLDAAFPLSAPLIADELKIYITAPMSAGPAFEADNRYVVPISCRYAAHTI